MNNKESGQAALGCLAVVASLAVFVLVLGSCASMKMVSAGEVGVLTQWGAVTGEVKDPGLHFVTPVKDDLEIMSVQTHVYGVKASAASHDLQSVETEVALNYRLDAVKAAYVYQTYRKDIVARIIVPAVQEAVKAATARYAAVQLITERPLIKANIEDLLKQRLEPQGIVVDTVNITNFEFSKDFSHAIEDKVTAEQKAQKATNDLERIKIEAQQTIEQAKAAAESIRIRSEALANSPKLVEWEAIQKWNGVLPQYMLGGTTPFIDVTPAK